MNFPSDFDQLSPEVLAALEKTEQLASLEKTEMDAAIAAIIQIIRGAMYTNATPELLEHLMSFASQQMTQAFFTQPYDSNNDNQ